MFVNRLLVGVVARAFEGRFVGEPGVVLREQVFVAGGEAVLLGAEDLVALSRVEVLKTLVAFACGVQVAGGRVACREGRVLCRILTASLAVT